MVWPCFLPEDKPMFRGRGGLQAVDVMVGWPPSVIWSLQGGQLCMKWTARRSRRCYQRMQITDWQEWLRFLRSAHFMSKIIRESNGAAHQLANYARTDEEAALVADVPRVVLFPLWFCKDCNCHFLYKCNLSLTIKMMYINMLNFSYNRLHENRL